MRISFILEKWSYLKLDDPFHRLSQRNRLIVAIVEIQRVGQVRSGLQKSVEFTFNHVVFVFWDSVTIRFV